MPVTTSPNSRRGGILFGLLVSALVGVCLLIAGGLYIARHLNVESSAGHNGDNVSIQTPVGDLDVRSRNVDPESMGVPSYPGAHRPDRRNSSDHDAVVEWNSNDGDGVTVTASELVTPDSAEKVADFYRDRLTHWDIKHEDGGVHFELKDGGRQRIVAIKAKKDGTHIGVVSVGKPGAN